MLKSTMTVAILAAIVFGQAQAHAQSAQGGTAAGPASQENQATETTESKAKKLDVVTVTGSLIPQSAVETATPTITITAQDIKARGFTTVADALQQSSFAMGSVQGAQSSASFTGGAQTLSMFGLPVGFVKYLVDGRPMGNFPALYNGSEAFNNLASIPMDMVDRIDILPGGQSSLYGSDAIAGVINIILKKKVDAPTLDVRYGWTSDGGGIDRRISFANGFTKGKLNVIYGLQYRSVDPIWGYQRDLTSQYYNGNPNSPAVAGRDFLVVDQTNGKYYFLDPNHCANTTRLFDGAEGFKTRTNGRQYCGSFNSPGWRTLQNGQETTNLYTHATYDVNDNLQLYGDLLYNYDEQKRSTGTAYTWWGTASDFGAFYDPNIGRLINLQRGFAPEEVGGYPSIMSKQYDNSYLLTVGGKGRFGESNWDYDVGFSHSDDHLVNRDFARFSDPIDQYFIDHVLGPQQGTYKGYPIYNPNYSAFYTPVPVQGFRSFTGYITSRAKTWDNLLRAQVTNGSLFSLKGGDAGIAAVLEAGNEGWNYSPDPRLLDGSVWGQSAVQGAGHRSRYAATTELRLPLLEQLTADVSGRWDNYHVGNNNVSRGTYMLGLEYRPIESLLLRGRFGTAFKVPTLADEFQGESGYYSRVPDYLNCGRLGYAPGQIANCDTPYDLTQYSGTQSGNPALKPITAKVWTYGVVWAPVERMSIAIDYLHWSIKDEVNQEDDNALSLAEYLCDTGSLAMSSGTCTNAFSKITRETQAEPGLLGQIDSIYTPKVNVSKEMVNAITASFNYAWLMGRFGKMSTQLSYSNVLSHTSQPYPTDPNMDMLRHPYYSTDFKSKVNGSVTWAPNDQWSGTVYFNRYGSTPNYVAQVSDSYSAAGAGRVAPWILYNASVTYNATPALGLSFLVNNVFNTMPPKDTSSLGTSGTPYDTTNYNVYGRTLFLEAKYQFGKNR